MSRILYFIVTVSFLDTFIQLPIITPYALELGASHILAGAIVAVYSLTNMVGNIFGGHWIDRFGRKKMLFAGMIAAFVILLFYPLAQSGEQLFIIRFFHGLAGGVLIPAAFAYIGDMKQKSSGKVMALTGACIGTAAIVGPAVGGAMAARAKVAYVFILVAVLFFISALLILMFISESSISTERGKASLRHFWPLLKNPAVLQASLAALALMISNGTMAFALPLKVAEMDLTSAATGMLLSLFGITALVVFLTPLNRIYDKYVPVVLVTIGIGIIGFVHIMLNIVSQVGIVTSLMIVYGIGFALVFPSMNKMINNAASSVDRGKAFGIFYAFFSLGVVAGSIVSGTSSETLGMPFLSSATTMVVVVIILLFISRIKRQYRKN
ncbi:MAG TPA: MFS transporter [Bacillota bacterium]|nr:MFS transporter [Bacillota bacterium]